MWCDVYVYFIYICSLSFPVHYLYPDDYIDGTAVIALNILHRIQKKRRADRPRCTDEAKVPNF